MSAATAKKNAASPVMPRLVANDNGYAAHKIAWIDTSGKILTMKVPAVIQAGGEGLATAHGGQIGSYKAEGSVYHCSTHVSSPMNLRNGDYPVSVANRVLFNHGLAKFGLLGMPVKAAVTLPFSDYYMRNGSINEALKERTIANFRDGKVEVIGSDAQPQVTEVHCFAEALSAWFDWAMNDDGTMTPAYGTLEDSDGEMLVVDIGGSTTDLASIGMESKSLLINHQKSGTAKVGVLDAISELNKLVTAAFVAEGVQGLSGHDNDLPHKLLESIMQKGTCFHFGRDWDFTPQRDQACKTVAERIVAFIQSKVGNHGGYFTILVVGGGAIVFRKWIEALFNNAQFGDEFSNARGALKFMRGL